MADLLNTNPNDSYGDDAIVTLSPREHIRLRPGMYLGRLGDGSLADDGIYVLILEVVDNSVDEFIMGAGRQIDISIEDKVVSVRDYGRGIPLKSLAAAVSEMNTGGKYGGSAFKKTVGLNGVGMKATNALSTYFEISSCRNGEKKKVCYSRGEITDDCPICPTNEENGTYVKFVPDKDIFLNYKYNDEFVETMMKNYSFLNTGLTIVYNGRRIHSRNGLVDLLRENMTNDPLYPIMHFTGTDIEVVITHANQYGEEYYSFVNGQHTTQGGTHLSAFREAVSRTIKEFYGKNFEYSDIRNGMVAAISIKVQEPVFESQTKTKLGSRDMSPDGSLTVAKFIGDFIKRELDNYLHIESQTAEIMLHKIQESEKERKAIAGVTKQTRERAKKASLNNKKLRDCRVHYCDAKGDRRDDTSLFITEGLSATGTITKVRNVETQAVFSLRGKPLNTFGKSQKDIKANEEFYLLDAALDIADGIENLRYNKVIIATDADVDGMHIRLLMITYFLQFYPDLVKKGHVYILQTPLFRVRNKNTSRGKKKVKDETYYCYTDDERVTAINRLGKNAEITRFKGLGEISADEFKDFIGPDMRLDQVKLRKEDSVKEMLEFYMGKNTMERQLFIVDNLVVEDNDNMDMTH